MPCRAETASMPVAKAREINAVGENYETKPNPPPAGALAERRI